MKPANIFESIPGEMATELFDTLLETNSFHLKRIVSSGQHNPEGEWFDQEKCEWVILLSGSAGLRFEGDDAVHELAPGDYVNIPTHCRHRVEWTDPEVNTVWLALHYASDHPALGKKV